MRYFNWFQCKQILDYFNKIGYFLPMLRYVCLYSEWCVKWEGRSQLNPCREIVERGVDLGRPMILEKVMRIWRPLLSIIKAHFDLLVTLWGEQQFHLKVVGSAHWHMTIRIFSDISQQQWLYFGLSTCTFKLDSQFDFWSTFFWLLFYTFVTGFIFFMFYAHYILMPFCLLWMIA